jgi:hypothetical protein
MTDETVDRELGHGFRERNSRGIMFLAMSDQTQHKAHAKPVAERRWPMALAVLSATLLQVIAPHGGHLPYWWLLPIMELALLVAIVAQDPGRIDRRGVTARRLTVALIAVMTSGLVVSEIVLSYGILKGVKVLNATTLLGRGAAIWVTNVIVFSLWFWEFDRGGAAERAASSTAVPASFAFPENVSPELSPAGWIPRYPDYLYLAFTNATAFSPTDTLPVRTWAKMAMMLEASISLVLAILVVARAINIL